MEKTFNGLARDLAPGLIKSTLLKFKLNILSTEKGISSDHENNFNPCQADCCRGHYIQNLKQENINKNTKVFDALQIFTSGFPRKNIVVNTNENISILNQLSSSRKYRFPKAINSQNCWKNRRLREAIRNISTVHRATSASPSALAPAFKLS